MDSVTRAKLRLRFAQAELALLREDRPADRPSDDELRGLAFSCRPDTIRRWLSGDAADRGIAKRELALIALLFPFDGEIADADIARWVAIAIDRLQEKAASSRILREAEGQLAGLRPQGTAEES
jgi:hypothetical protein